MVGVDVFIVEETGAARAFLRCYIGDSSCPAETTGGYHNALAPVGDLDDLIDGRGHLFSPPVAGFIGDPRWPKACACGWPLEPPPSGYQDGHEGVNGQRWQVWTDRLYRRADSGLVGTLQDHGAGALYDALWLPEAWRHTDGHAWSLVLPPGRGAADVWHLCGPASNAPGQVPAWNVTGTAPNLTANPSIRSPNYHGWLRDGVLVDD